MTKNQIIAIAIICHEANKAYCEFIGDHSQKNWCDAEQWQRDSAIKGVEFRLDNPNARDDAQHNSWMKEKIDQGWVYGPIKDAEKKTHPCLVPFNSLPVEQQIKDRLFCAIVDAHITRITVTFGEAVKALKQGRLITRAGWNGKGLFVFMQVPSMIPSDVVPKMQSLPQSVKDEFQKRTSGPAMAQAIRYSNQLAIVDLTNEIKGWAPSVSDALAEDWVVLD